MFFCSSVSSKFTRRGGSVTLVTLASRGRTYGRRMKRAGFASEGGQAAIEWVGLLLLVSISLAAAIAFLPAVEGRPLGAAITRVLACSVKQDCHGEGAASRRAYGEHDAALVRANAPNIVYEGGTLTLPVDYRRCRSHRCSDAADDHDLDVHRAARGGAPATALTHGVRKRGKTYIQFWLYRQAHGGP